MAMGAEQNHEVRRGGGALRRWLVFTGFLAVCVAGSSSAWAHGGGLNAEGCHNNRKTGDYHCHRAPGWRDGSGASPGSGWSAAEPNSTRWRHSEAR